MEADGEDGTIDDDGTTTKDSNDEDENDTAVGPCDDDTNHDEVDRAGLHDDDNGVVSKWTVMLSMTRMRTVPVPWLTSKEISATAAATTTVDMSAGKY